jgi:UDP-N-acetylglucosamine/UDP-N-acetylgalactosamine diphosphorylase
MTSLESELRDRASQHGQEHLFAFWDTLDGGQQDALLTQLAAVDFDLAASQAQLLQGDSEGDLGNLEFSPPELFPLERPGDLGAQAQAATAAGEELLSAGKVGFLLVAGGQASRLGYDGPKGAFPVGPVTGRSLFELHARRLRAAQEKYGQSFDWYVMTSPANDATTRAFFEQHDHFGLDIEQLVFFPQAMIPALDLEGRILMSGPGQLFLAPNGHGGTLAALRSSGVLDRAKQKGIETFSYFQVDNPLVRPADPLFLGLHQRQGARMSSKVVSKRDAGEKVGVIGKVNGVLGCIEYSDLPESCREARDDSGRLAFGAGNIAAHLLQVDFVEELTAEKLELPWHVARKRMKVIGADGQPTEMDGAKFETFIFDALGKSVESVTLEVAREFEFSPVKNAVGEDSPLTARQALCDLFGGWVQAAGQELPEKDEHGTHPIEIDPLVAEDCEGFLAGGVPSPVALPQGHLYDRD